MQSYKDIDEYIAGFPVHVQKNLQKIRMVIQNMAPAATEKISYGIPTFTYHGNLVHFAAYDTHYAFYPGAAPIVEFKEQLKDYSISKGTVRFPLDKPIPFDLIKAITAFRVMQAKSKKK